MRADLLGYLLGALDSAEHAEVEAALQADPRLAAECARLEQTIAPLSEDEAWIDPPPRLADRTTAFVEAYADQDDPLRERRPPLREIATGNGDDVPFASPAASALCASPLSSHEDEMRPRSRRWSLADAVVAAGICAAAAMLIIPAIANSRKQAAITHCQNNLRQLGHALVDYSYDSDGHFPLVPASGNLGVAGIYAPILKEAGRLRNETLLLCPGSAVANEADTFAVPSTEEVQQQEGKQLLATQRSMGGSYGYAFGYEDEDGAYRANRNRSRPRFALLADSPSLHLKGRQSANHGGCGQNVLFEDNHVEYLQRCCASEASDNVFLSDRGYVEAGRHWNDAVVGNSWARPVLLSESSPH